MNKLINDFMETNYKNIISMAKKIIKNKDYEEVAHHCIENFYTIKNAEELIKKGEAMKYISGMIYNSYHSSSSPFIRLHKVYLNGKEIHKEDIMDYKELLIDNNIEYDYDKDELLNKIESILNEKHPVQIWYILTLLKLYIDNPNYVTLSKQVNIPRTSISKSIKEAIKYIKTRI